MLPEDIFKEYSDIENILHFLQLSLSEVGRFYLIWDAMKKQQSM